MRTSDLELLRAEAEACREAADRLDKQIAEEVREQRGFTSLVEAMRLRAGSRAFTISPPEYTLQGRMLAERGGGRSHGGWTEVMTPQPGEFHWRGGLTFKRLSNGDVEIKDHRPFLDDYGFQHWAWEIFAVIPSSEWASIVAHVTVGGETTESYYAALTAHSGALNRVAAGTEGSPKP